MPNRRTVLAAAAAATGATLVGTPAFAGNATIKSLIDSWLPKLTYQAVAVGAFRGREQYVVNGGTIFQIGSITKTFTALSLAIADRTGWLSVDDQLSRHLPRRYPEPPKGITLAHLASHTSGLDRLPPGLLEDPELDLRDPYAHFTEDELIEALRRTTLLSEPGTKYLYSNYGAGLLGHALSRDFEQMVRTRITGPLGLHDTAITLTPAQLSRKAQGYDQNGSPTPDWRLPSMQGAGALYGTADDMIRYMRAHVGTAPRYLKPALDLVQQPRFEIKPGVHVALGWHTSVMPSGRTAVWHDGGTGGFTSFIAFCPSTGAGVAVLVNKYLALEIEEPAIAVLDAL
jgi:D-alanyl-D-alanine-carboxypeptidase/D-alanyl-D-alanine-endopeptidase